MATIYKGDIDMAFNLLDLLVPGGGALLGFFGSLLEGAGENKKIAAQKAALQALLENFTKSTNEQMSEQLGDIDEVYSSQQSAGLTKLKESATKQAATFGGSTRSFVPTNQLQTDLQSKYNTFLTELGGQRFGAITDVKDTASQQIERLKLGIGMQQAGLQEQPWYSNLATGALTGGLAGIKTMMPKWTMPGGLDKSVPTMAGEMPTIYNESGNQTLGIEELIKMLLGRVGGSLQTSGIPTRNVSPYNWANPLSKYGSNSSLRTLLGF
jgi:hypothetical protein